MLQHHLDLLGAVLSKVARQAKLKKKKEKDCELEALAHRDSQQLDEYGTEVNVS